MRYCQEYVATPKGHGLRKTCLLEYVTTPGGRNNAGTVAPERSVTLVVRTAGTHSHHKTQRRPEDTATQVRDNDRNVWPQEGAATPRRHGCQRT